MVLQASGKGMSTPGQMGNGQADSHDGSEGFHDAVQAAAQDAMADVSSLPSSAHLPPTPPSPPSLQAVSMVPERRRLARATRQNGCVVRLYWNNLCPRCRIHCDMITLLQVCALHALMVGQLT